MLAGTAAFINSVAGLNGDNPTNLTRTDVNNVVKALLNNNAYTIMDNIEGRLFALVKSSLMVLKALPLS